MFGRLNVKKDGAQATGVVLDVELKFPTVTQTPMNPTPDQWLTMQVKWGDGTQADVRCEVSHKDFDGAFGTGMQVPLRYDPKHKDRVQVDVDLLKARRAEKAAEKKAAAVEWARKWGDNPLGPAQLIEELDRKLAAGEISREEWERDSNRVLDEEF